MKTISTRFVCLLAVLSLSAVCTASNAGIAVKSGDRIAFLGDSITAQGWGNPGGYVRLVIAGLEAAGVKAEGIGAGISGHKSNQMLERLQRDVISKKPAWMTLSCGVNDVWHGEKGVPLDDAQAAAKKYEMRPGEPEKGTYKGNITAIVDKAQAAGIKVIILTATVIGEELDNENNKKLAPYNDFLRSLATEEHCQVADLNAMFQERIKAAGNTTGKPGRLLTADGVHMNPAGDAAMASGILRVMGMNEAELKKAQEAWQDIPGGANLKVSVGGKKRLTATAPVSLRQCSKLELVAVRKHQTVAAMLNAIYNEEVKALLKPKGEFESVDAIFDANKAGKVQAALQEKFDKRVKELLKP